MRVVSSAVVVVAVLTAAGIGVRYWVVGHLNAVYCALSLFFSTNLLICYWETCLFRQDLILERADHWRRRQAETGRTPAVEFLTTMIPLSRVLSPSVAVDLWAVYSLYDGSYTDRRSYGFNVDVANGCFTAVPTLVLYAAFTVPLLPAAATGILGVMLSWQWTYATSVYLVSFFVAGRHRLISGTDQLLYIWGTNSVWVLFGLFGLFVSIRLIVDGDYTVLGYR